MAITSGFFDASSGDRRYTSRQFGELFTGIISDGIFHSVGKAFWPEARNSQVWLGSGRAWCRGTWLNSDGYYAVDIPANSHPNYSRYDAIVLRFDSSSSVRANTVEYISGSADATPRKPPLTDNSLVKQVPICYIFRPAGSTTVSQSQIDYVVGTEASPYITGPLKSINIDDVVRSANATIRDTNERLQRLVSDIENKSTKLTSDVDTIKKSYADWVKNAEAALGAAPNAATIIEAKRQSDLALATANNAKTSAVAANSKVAEHETFFNNAKSTFTTTLAEVQKLKTDVATGVASISGMEGRIRNAETAANKAEGFATRISAVERALGDVSPTGTARNFYTRPTGPRKFTNMGENDKNAMLRDIGSGTFKTLAIGDTFDVGALGHQFLVAAFDYFYGLNVLRHHVVLLPVYSVSGSGFTTAESCPGGYATDTALLGERYSAAWSALQGTFGSLNGGFPFQEEVSSAVNEQGVTTQSVSKVTRSLDMNESMVFGHPSWGTYSRFDAGRRDDILPLFQLYPEHRKCPSGRYWLRSFKAQNIVMGVDADGRPDGWICNTAGVYRRPIFLLGGPA